MKLQPLLQFGWIGHGYRLSSDLFQTRRRRFRAMMTQRSLQFRYCVRRLCQVTKRLCNRLTDSGWRGIKQAVNERTSLDYLDTKLAGVGNSQMFGVVRNDHDLVQCRFIFLTESVDHDQGGSDQVPVIVMHPSRNAVHESVVVIPGNQMPIVGGPLKCLEPFAA